MSIHLEHAGLGQYQRSSLVIEYSFFFCLRRARWSWLRYASIILAGTSVIQHLGGNEASSIIVILARVNVETMRSRREDAYVTNWTKHPLQYLCLQPSSIKFLFLSSVVHTIHSLWTSACPLRSLNFLILTAHGETSLGGTYRSWVAVEAL